MYVKKLSRWVHFVTMMIQWLRRHQCAVYPFATRFSRSLVFVLVLSSYFVPPLFLASPYIISNKTTRFNLERRGRRKAKPRAQIKARVFLWSYYWINIKTLSFSARALILDLRVCKPGISIGLVLSRRSHNIIFCRAGIITLLLSYYYYYSISRTT